MQTLYSTFYRMAQVTARTGLSSSTIWLKVKHGEFPQPVRISGPSGRAVGWVSAEVDDWIAARIAERDSA